MMTSTHWTSKSSTATVTQTKVFKPLLSTIPSSLSTWTNKESTTTTLPSLATSQTSDVVRLYQLDNSTLDTTEARRSFYRWEYMKALCCLLFVGVSSTLTWIKPAGRLVCSSSMLETSMMSSLSSPVSSIPPRSLPETVLQLSRVSAW